MTLLCDQNMKKRESRSVPVDAAGVTPTRLLALSGDRRHLSSSLLDEEQRLGDPSRKAPKTPAPISDTKFNLITELEGAVADVWSAEQIVQDL